MKRIAFLLLTAILLSSVVGNVTAQTTETDIFGIEIGQLVGYSFQDDGTGDDVGIVADQLMGIHFGMTENMELGFVFLQDTDIQLARMTYFIQENLGFQLSTGNSMGEPAGGVGVFASPIRREFDDTITTALRLSLDYLVPGITTAIDEGVVGVTISGKIAF